MNEESKLEHFDVDDEFAILEKNKKKQAFEFEFEFEIRPFFSFPNILSSSLEEEHRASFKNAVSYCRTSTVLSTQVASHGADDSA